MSTPTLLLLLLACALANAQNPPDKSPRPASAGWSIRFDGSGSRPALADGVLYIGSADGAVYALDANTGETKWRFQTGEDLDLEIGPLILNVPPGSSATDVLMKGAAATPDTGKDKAKPIEGVRRVDMQPAVENGTVFVGSGDGSFYAIDAATGKKKWSYLAGLGMAQRNSDLPVPPPILIHGTVYFTTKEGLYALNAQTGEKKWFFETLSEVENHGPKRPPSGPILSDGVFFLTAWPFSTDHMKSLLYAVDPESGKAKWISTVDGGTFMSAPLVGKGMVFFSVTEKGSDMHYVNRKKIPGKATLYALDSATGQTKWKFDAPAEYSTSRALLATGNMVFLGTDKGLFALDLATGHQLWTFGKDEPLAMQADEQYVFVDIQKWGFGGMKDTLYALSRSNGAQKWSRGVSGESGVNSAGLLLTGGVLYASRGHLQAVDPATGKELWTFKGSGREFPGLISPSRIFLNSSTTTVIGSPQVDRGFVFAIDPKTGKQDP
jgi:outer membrane protein assembly factor BamB